MPDGTPAREPQRGLARAVRALREGAGLGPAEVARRAGIPVSSVSRVESGKHDPTWAEMRRVAKGLGVTLEVLAEVAEQKEDEARAD